MERPANMLQNGMPPQGANMNSMQRPQPGNPHQQIHAQIMTDLRSKISQLPPGWQSTFDIGQRAQAIMQLVSALRMLEQNITKCIQIAENFEDRTLHGSSSKDQYMQSVTSKLQEIKMKRLQNAQMQPGQMNMQMNNGTGMPQNNAGMGNMNMMQNNGMGNMSMNISMTPNQGLNMSAGNDGQQNSGFPAQLQRPMQPSPLPPQQQQNQPPTGTMDPSALQNNQIANFGQPNQAPQQQQNMGTEGQNQPGAFQQQQIAALARQLITQTPEDRKSLLRQQFLAQLDDQKKRQLLAQKRDPLINYFMMQAADILRKRAQAGQGAQAQQGNGMQMGGVAMQQTPSQSGAQNFDFTSILGQQANAIKSQASGEDVVPASNNANNLSLGASQMNMSQGINPQAVTNQGQGNNNAQLQQLLAAQQEKARREQMQQQNQNAQNQAMLQQQAAQQLRGQPGGLNAQNAFGNGQVNSPAMNMNMLNRPMAPPGGQQQTPATPQQPRPGMSQTPVNNPANQLAQHHQTMLNQNIQQNPGALPSREAMLNMLPPAIRERLGALAPQQMDQVLLSYFQKANAQQNANMQNRAMNGAQQGMPGNVGSAVPTFNSQPNQQPQQAPDAQLQQRLQQHQNSQLRQRALDLMPLPKAVLSSLSLAVPENVNTWGKLKQHIAQSQAVLPPSIQQKLQNTQQQYYEQRPDEVRQAMQSLAQQMQQMRATQQAQGQGNQQQQQPQQGVQGRPASAMAMPNGQAPQAQMMAPAAQPSNQAGANANANQQIRIPAVQQPTPQEIQSFRQSIPHAQNASDEQIRSIIVQRRQHQASTSAMQAQAQQQLRNQMQRAQPPAGGQQAQQVGPQPGQPMQARQQVPQPPAKQPPNAQTQGQKRQQSEDVVEIPKPTTQAPAAPANMTQAVPRMPATREEFQKLSLEQQQAITQKVRQMEALKRAQNSGQQAAQPQGQAQQQQQQAPPATNNELQQRLRAIFAEVVAANPKGQPVQLDAKSLEQAKVALKKLWPAIAAITQTLSTAIRAPNFGEPRVREAIRNLMLVQNNAANANGDIKDYLSVTLADLKQVELFVGKYFSDMKALKEQAQAAASGQAQQQVQAQAKPQQPSKAQQQPASKPQVTRKASAANKVPPAPTENKTFDFGSPRPDGVPKYESSRTDLTADKLKLPANKKRKTADSQDSKVTSQSTSPKVVDSKPQSQEQVTKTPQQMSKTAEPEKAWKCDDMYCDASVNGFETEAQLKEHKEIVHKPVEDPLQFMLENAAKALGLDQDGNPLPAKKNAKAATPAKPANKKETPSATPASNGKLPAKVSAEKPADAAVPPREKTLMEVMAEKIGFEMPSEKKEEPAPPSASVEGFDDDDGLRGLLSSAFASEDLFEDLQPGWEPSDADWDQLPRGTAEFSPEQTPSDQSSQSSHASDISMNEKMRINFSWDAFNNGDTYVPEILRLNKLGLGGGAKSDVAMGGADGQSKSGDNKEEDPWDWSEDMIDYDAFFENGNDKPFDV